MHCSLQLMRSPTAQAETLDSIILLHTYVCVSLYILCCCVCVGLTSCAPPFFPLFPTHTHQRRSPPPPPPHRTPPTYTPTPMQALRAAALEALEMLSDMPSLRMENISTEKAILAAPDYNCECMRLTSGCHLLMHQCITQCSTHSHTECLH